MEKETIAAIATGITNSGISIIRISGSEAIEVADKIFVSPSGKKLCDCVSHTVHYGFICEQGSVVDEVMVIVMRAPKTYTREDVVEIDCHGGVMVTKKIFDLVIRSGARTAEPGEFTKRAFLNGRIDLSRAEAVIDIINAKNNMALKNSVKQLRGKMYEIICDLRERILRDTAYIEAALDDPEHMSLDGFADKLSKNVSDVAAKLKELYRNADNGRFLKDGITTLIIGKPNAGKSSLMNLLLNEDRAIVTEIPGTTRDTIEESIQIGDISLNIIDTAGIRNSGDAIEQMGVKKAIENISRADLILYVVDSSIPLDENDNRIIELIRDKRVIVLYNKTDLEAACGRDEIEKLLGDAVLDFSAKNGDGLLVLQEKITEMFFAGKIDINEELFITNGRQKELVGRAIESLVNVSSSIENGLPEDFFTIDLMEAYTSLGKIIGEDVEDDLADKIFSEFCMGK